MEVLCPVPILRIVASTDVPTGPADPQMEPGTAEVEALFATARAWAIGPHKVQVTALRRMPPPTELGATNLHRGAKLITDHPKPATA
jgi:hypothetical protein